MYECTYVIGRLYKASNVLRSFNFNGKSKWNHFRDL